MKIINSNGIVLKKNDFGEADRIITVFLEDFGRTSFVLKGIRKSKKRDLTSGEPLTFSQFSFYKKGENRILTSVDSIDFFYNIKTDITRLQIALYIISILNEILVEGEEQKKLYNIFYKSLNYINSNSVEYNNYLLLLYILHQVILIEGLEFEKIGSKFFDIKNSRIVNEYSENAINLEKDEYDIINSVCTKGIKNLLENGNNIKGIINIIYIFEKYLNYHLETKLEFRKYYLEAWNG